VKQLVILLAAIFAASASSQTYVAPHVRKDGTYVEGHHRSNPNRTVDDNYGTRGNYNPYTGQQGTQPRSYERPYQLPSNPPPAYDRQCGYTANGRYVCR